MQGGYRDVWLSVRAGFELKGSNLHLFERRGGQGCAILIKNSPLWPLDTHRSQFLCIRNFGRWVEPEEFLDHCIAIFLLSHTAGSGTSEPVSKALLSTGV